ncbi:MAG TPA: PAS domain-containing sensor histidine kinase [Candidatus Paceibacterota bacterium]|nr:PAS domain-containing sensor histidine kinase [Candidatus Paceibacterota bacterium]
MASIKQTSNNREKKAITNPWILALTSWSIMPMIFLTLTLGVQIFLNFLYLDDTLKLLVSSLAIVFLSLTWVTILGAVVKNFKISSTQKQVSNILLSINDPVIAYDNSFRIIFINAAAESLLGVTNQKIASQQITPEMNNIPEYGLLVKIMFPSLAPVVLRKQTTVFPQKMVLKLIDPKEITLEITTTQIFNDKHEIMGFLKIVQDKTQEESVARTQKDFITVAAHQLRTPLTGLNWAVDLLMKQELGSLTSEQLATVSQMKEALANLSLTVNNVLNIAQVEEGRFGFDFKENDLNEAILTVLSSLEPVAKKRNIRLSYYRPDPALPHFVFDIKRVETALQIFVDNAIKYNTDKGEVRIKVNKTSDNLYAEIRVEDTGIGIPSREMGKLFTKFFRAGNAIKNETEGTGLGLYIAKNIIDSHGGKVSVNSIEGRGSVFSFTLPLQENLIPPQTDFNP